MAACLFISIKFVVDRFVLFIDDFVRLSGMNRKNIEVLEIGILVNILGFDVNFSELEISREMEVLANGGEELSYTSDDF